MIKNYLNIAFRVFKRNKFYTFLNLIGLSLGVSSTLVIFTYVFYETNYDKHNTEYENIIRITEVVKDDEGKSIHAASSPSQVIHSIADKINGIDRYCRIFKHEAILSQDNKINRFKETKMVFSDSTIFDIFTINVLDGLENGGLNVQNSLVIVKSEAERLFGSVQNALNQPLTVENENSKMEFTINAVVEDLPPTSHFEFNYIGSIVTLDKTMPWYNNWYWPPMYSYALINNNVPIESIQEQVNSELQVALPESEKSRRYFVQELKDIYTGSHLENEWKTNNRKEYIQIFSLIGLFTLVIACINYINLTTAKSLSRAKEVGIRKVMGAGKIRLVLQYLGESAILILFSFLVAFALSEWVLLALFNKLIQKNMELGFLLEWPYFGYLFLLFLVVSILSGIVPAFVLAGYNPSSILRKVSSTSKGHSYFRKILVVFQFMISAFLIAGTLIIIKQINFIQNKNLGFEKDLVVALRLNHREDQINVKQLKERLLQYSSIHSAAASAQLPGVEIPYDNPILPENSQKEEGYNMYTYAADIDFARVFDFELLEGRLFDNTNPADETSSILINESAVERFGWEIDNSIGRKVDLTWFADGAELRKTQVVGIIKDFHFKSLHKSIDPIVIYVNNHEYYTEFLTVRLENPNLKEAMEIINKEWSAFSPDRPIDYKFLNDEINQYYLTEIRAGKIMTSFTILAIIISCLGLYGLASYSSEIRLKEFSIRKILGADIATIISLFGQEFLILVGIANLIAFPLVWIGGNRWLQGFAYRIDIDPMLFVFAFLSAILITIITISYQSFKVAKNNPASILKDE